MFNKFQLFYVKKLARLSFIFLYRISFSVTPTGIATKEPYQNLFQSSWKTLMRLSDF